MAQDQEQDGPPLSELESLQLKANNITDDSLESTRRMIQLCEDSQGAGIKTLDMLDAQGEQLNKIEEGLDNINSEMKQAEKHITGMEKFCGLCVCPWKRPRVKDSNASSWKASKDNKKSKVVKSQPTSNSAPEGPYVKRINNDAREDEMEENMQAVGSILGNLKNMAQDMNQTLEEQNPQIDRITMKSNSADVRINAANKRTEKLLN